MRPLILRLCSCHSSRFASYQIVRSITWQAFLPKTISQFFSLPEQNAPVPIQLNRMDITKATFPQEAVKLLQDIADSHFIAFDFEFSGIAERNRDRSGKPSLEERYEETRVSVQEYQPLQIGLTVAKFDEANTRYVLEPYNLNISPLPLLRERYFTRKWSMNSGAISFLQRNGFDFGRQMTQGVPYLSKAEEHAARRKMGADTSKRENMVTKPDDQILIAHVRESIADWQRQAKEEQEECLNIPNGKPLNVPEELNAYHRRLVHQTVQTEYPAMKTTSMGHFIQITNPTQDQVASQKSVEQEWREREIAKSIGLRWIFDGIVGADLSRLPLDYVAAALPKDADAPQGVIPAQRFLNQLIDKLKERRKVLIGHNCLTDLMFLYKMIVGDLPMTLAAFKEQLHDLFPAIIDTKFVANCHSEKYGRLSLGEVVQDLAQEKNGPVIYTPPDYDRYANHVWLHEAGYDSYITAILAIQMAAKLNVGGSARKKDHDRQQNEVAQANTEDLLDFGVQEGYETAKESQEPVIQSESLPVISTHFGHRQTDSINSVASESTAYSDRSTPSVVAIKQKVPAAPVNWNDESRVDSLRSAFATTSIYDSLDSSAMPGDETPRVPDKEPQEILKELVQQGKLMPRWSEEGGFWEVYGNKLQVNGTAESVLDIKN